MFDLKFIACLALLGGTSVVACDLVNRAVDRRVLPKPQESAPADWNVGSTTHVVLALKTEDAERNGCATTQRFDTFHCEYDGAKRRVARSPDEPIDDNLRFVVQPFKTAVGEHLVAIGGIWHTPELAFRRHQEPSRERRGAQLQTFYAACDVTFIGKLDTLDVRYDFGKKWTPAKNVAVARAERCTILEQPELSSSGLSASR